MKRYVVGCGELVLSPGDITALAVDAIVNAANERMLGGGGVDGAIHRAAGPGLVEACRQITEVRPDVRCPTGEARITDGCELPARYVIHTVGPIYVDAGRSAPLLRAAYRSSLALANDHDLRSVAFPAISCGVFGYPLADAATVALQACRDDIGQLRRVQFALFDADAFRAFATAADQLFHPLLEPPG